MEEIKVHGFVFKRLNTRGEYTRYQDPRYQDLTLHVREAPDPHDYDSGDLLTFSLNYKNIVKTIWLGTPEDCFKSLFSLYDFMTKAGLDK